MNELALFAGDGGGILAGHLLGWRTVCAVERDAYCACVLANRQNEGFLPAFPIWSDVESFDGVPWRGVVDVVSGGFPCQDISAAGKGAGLAGARSGLWYHMLRIIGEVQPEWVFVENSDKLIGRGVCTVEAGLQAAGYAVEVGLLSAAACGANHTRERCWIAGRAIAAYAVRDGAGEEYGALAGEAGAAPADARGRARTESGIDGAAAYADGDECARQRLHTGPGAEGQAEADAVRADEAADAVLRERLLRRGCGCEGE